jgi:hypothetical protein
LSRSPRDGSLTVPFPTPLKMAPNTLSGRCLRPVAQVLRRSRARTGCCEGGMRGRKRLSCGVSLWTWRLGRFTSHAESRGNPWVSAAESCRSWCSLCPTNRNRAKIPQGLAVPLACAGEIITNRTGAGVGWFAMGAGVTTLNHPLNSSVRHASMRAGHHPIQRPGSTPPRRVIPIADHRPRPRRQHQSALWVMPRAPYTVARQPRSNSYTSSTFLRS